MLQKRVGVRFATTSERTANGLFRRSSYNKSFGIERCIISGAISTEEPSPRDSQSEYGQLNGCLVYQSQGRNTLPGTHPDNTRTLELVHTAGHLSGCTPCPREIKCPSRPRIKGISRRHRLEARPSSDQTLSVSMQDRPLCNQTDLSTQAVHQLATRPEGCPHRCSKCELACPQGICFPSIQLAACCPKQSSSRPDRASPCCPSMASTAMVATPLKSSNSRTGASSKQEISSDKPEQPRPGPPNVPTPPSSRVSCLIQRYETEGFSKDVANLLVAATRSSTSKTYESSWRRWCGWCSERKINPLSATLTNILSFFADCFKEGLQYRTINVLRSALSSIHPKVDNFCVGQYPYVVNILRGILNNRPPKPRYTYTWDLHAVTEHIKKMGTNNSLSLKHLSWKLATLFFITCPKRVSSLTSLNLNYYKMVPEGVVFTLTVPTKGTRPDETIQAFFTRYPADPYLCPVHCFTHYLLLTKEKRAVQEGKPNNLFISYIKPHHPIAKATLARWILSLIKEAGIDTKIFKAHSLRGGSTTVAANALVPLQEIMNMADWSNASTFRQHYYKPVHSSTFGETVLSS